MIFPAAVRYQSELAEALANLKAVGIEPDHRTIDRVTDLINQLQTNIEELAALKAKEPESESTEAHCYFLKDELLPKMLEVREVVDRLEGYVADDLWPLPTYQEMLFIR